MHDVLILDLDGVVYIGPDAVPFAIDALNAQAKLGVRLTAATNNANRPPTTVADHLRRLGLHITTDDVMTSAQAAAQHLASDLASGSAVLAVGGEGVADALAAVGLTPLRASADLASSNEAADRAQAVMMGYGPLVAWFDLAAAHWAIVRGKRWIATNTDPTVPQPYGPAPGNGAFVALLERSTGRVPEVIGKPKPALFEALLRHSGTRNALVIGDRLDTDIDGAVAAGLESLLVCTGVHSPADLSARGFTDWPTYVSRDLRSLDGPMVAVRLEGGVAVADSDDPLVAEVLTAANAVLHPKGGPPDAPSHGTVGLPSDASPLIDLRALVRGSVHP